MYTSTEVHDVQGSERFLFCTHWLNPLDPDRHFPVMIVWFEHSYYWTAVLYFILVYWALLPSAPLNLELESASMLIGRYLTLILNLINTVVDDSTHLMLVKELYNSFFPMLRKYANNCQLLHWHWTATGYWSVKRGWYPNYPRVFVKFWVLLSRNY